MSAEVLPISSEPEQEAVVLRIPMQRGESAPTSIYQRRQLNVRRGWMYELLNGLPAGSDDRKDILDWIEISRQQ